MPMGGMTSQMHMMGTPSTTKLTGQDGPNGGPGGLEEKQQTEQRQAQLPSLLQGHDPTPNNPLSINNLNSFN